MPGRGSFGLAIACACMALSACGGGDNAQPSAAAPPPPIKHAHGDSANVLVLADLSQQVAGDRLGHLQAALDSLVRAVPGSDRVGLAVFADHFNPAVPVLGADQNRARLRSAIHRFQAGGDSAPYDAVLQAYGIQRELASSSRVNTVLVVAHAEDDASRSTFARVRRMLGSQRADGPRVRIFSVAYDTAAGSGLSEALQSFAKASGGKSFSASQQNLGPVLRRAWASL
jgi:uncharacterized protein (DUF58 family)